MVYFVQFGQLYFTMQVIVSLFIYTGELFSSSKSTSDRKTVEYRFPPPPLYVVRNLVAISKSRRIAPISLATTVNR